MLSFSEGVSDGQAGEAEDSKNQPDRGHDWHSPTAQPGDRDHARDAGGSQDPTPIQMVAMPKPGCAASFSKITWGVSDMSYGSKNRARAT